MALVLELMAGAPSCDAGGGTAFETATGYTKGGTAFETAIGVSSIAT